MKIKRLKDYLTENNSFEEKMIDDLEYEDIAKQVFRIALEQIDGVVGDADTFVESLRDSISVDETDLVELTIDQQLDLCIYIEDGICPKCKWDDLAAEIYKNAVYGLSVLVNDILSKNIYDNLATFINVNKLGKAVCSERDPMGYFPPARVRDIKNGDVTEYRNVEGDGNFDIYRFGGFGVNLYFSVRK